MALNADTNWEIRDTGDIYNGGGFHNRLPGTSVDYSQQNVCELNPVDLAGSAASVTITSAAGGFTAAMTGNLMYIYGGVNFTTGFYEIVQYNNPNSVNLDRIPCSGAGSGGTAKVGGALSRPNFATAYAVSGNIIYVKKGTYSASGNWSIGNSNVRVFGYDSDRSQDAETTDRPVFDMGAYRFSLNDGAMLENFIISGSNDYNVYSSDKNNALVRNCKITNTANTGTKYCIYATGSASGKFITIIDNELIGTAGATNYGVRASAYLSAKLMFNFFHDLTYGFYGVTDAGNVISLFNTFARCANYSIVHGDENASLIAFNSFYSCDIHIYLSGELSQVFGNTIDSAVTNGIYSASSNKIISILNNDFWNNGTDIVNLILDEDNIGLDPLWVNPAADDFNFQAGSPNIDQALGIELGVG